MIKNYFGSRYIGLWVVIIVAVRMLGGKSKKGAADCAAVYAWMRHVPLSLYAAHRQPSYGQLSRQEKLLFITRAGLRRLFNSDAPLKVVIEGAQLEQAALSARPTMVVCPHFPYPANLIALMDRFGDKRLIVLALDPVRIATSHDEVIGARRQRITYIKSDRYCFVRAKKAMTADAILVVNPDSRGNASPCCNQIHMGVFEFARRMQANVLMMQTTVNRDGVVVLKSRLCPPQSSAQAMAEQFVAHQKPEKTYTIAAESVA